jgi:hypothetical protein
MDGEAQLKNGEKDFREKKREEKIREEGGTAGPEESFRKNREFRFKSEEKDSRYFNGRTPPARARQTRKNKS